MKYLLLLLFIPTFALAQAPDSLDDALFILNVDSGDGTIFRSSGSHLMIADGETVIFTEQNGGIPVTGAPFPSGFLTYSSSGSVLTGQTAPIEFGNTTISAELTFTFDTISSGSYTFTGQGEFDGGTQSGTFVAFIPNDAGYIPIAKGTSLDSWFYFGSWPWAYIDQIGIGGWSYLEPSDEGLWVLRLFDEEPLLLLNE